MAFPNQKPPFGQGSPFASLQPKQAAKPFPPKKVGKPKKKKSKQAAMDAVGKMAKDRGISGFEA